MCIDGHSVLDQGCLGLVEKLVEGASGNVGGLSSFPGVCLACSTEAAPIRVADFAGLLSTSLLRRMV